VACPPVRAAPSEVITPQGVNNSWSPGTDVGFVNKATDMVEAIANVDKERVYAGAAWRPSRCSPRAVASSRRMASALRTPRTRCTFQQCQASAPASKCVSWTQCDDGVEVVFCTVVASTQPLGGHILYNNDTSLDLSEVAWRFFKKFQK